MKLHRLTLSQIERLDRAILLAALNRRAKPQPNSLKFVFACAAVALGLAIGLWLGLR